MNGVANHGNGMETSMKLAIAPDLVDMDKVALIAIAACRWRHLHRNLVGTGGPGEDRRPLSRRHAVPGWHQ